MTDTHDPHGPHTKDSKDGEDLVTREETGTTPATDQPDPTQEQWAEDRTEQLPRVDATQQLPTETDRTAAPEEREPVDTTVFGAAAAWPPPVPPRPTGPHAPAILLGLVCLAVAGIVLAEELGNLTVDWGDVGPLGFVAVGAVLVVLGAVGLISSNRRNART